MLECMAMANPGWCLRLAVWASCLATLQHCLRCQRTILTPPAPMPGISPRWMALPCPVQSQTRCIAPLPPAPHLLYRNLTSSCTTQEEIEIRVDEFMHALVVRTPTPNRAPPPRDLQGCRSGGAIGLG